jgi:hypothetical protein
MTDPYLSVVNTHDNVREELSIRLRPALEVLAQRLGFDPKECEFEITATLVEAMDDTRG